MPVTFISSGYDSPPAGAAWANAMPAVGLATYGVRSYYDWTVTPGTGLSVQISAGRGYGYGVTDHTFQVETIALDPVEAGTRWDLIAVRRDWRFDPRRSAFVKVNGGANPVLPAGRLGGAGNMDDQPLALVPVTPEGVDGTRIIDLRTFAGDGGGLMAHHELVLTFLNSAGTRININGIDWVRKVVNGKPEWVDVTGARVVGTDLADLHGVTGLSTVTTNANGDGSIPVPAHLSTVRSVRFDDATSTAFGPVLLKWTAATTTPTKITFRAYSTSGAALPNFPLALSWSVYGQK